MGNDLENINEMIKNKQQMILIHETTLNRRNMVSIAMKNNSW